jgi:ATP-dependent DNA helicase RecQ
LHDTALQALSIERPATLETLRGVHGLGEKRLADFGAELVTLIGDYCREHNLTYDVAAASHARQASTHQESSHQESSHPGPMLPTPPRPSPRSSETKEKAFALFAQGASLEEAVEATDRATSTISGYLCQYIASQNLAQIDAWVDATTYRRVVDAAANNEEGRLKPIFDQLGGEIPYDIIRLVVTHLQSKELPNRKDESSTE